MNQPPATRVRRLGQVAAGLLIAGIASTGMSPAHAAEAQVNLGTVGAFSVIAGSTVTNTGPSVLGADLGLFPGTAITGFPPGLVQGAVHATDAVANQAQQDLTTAYNDAAGRSMTGAVSADLAGQILTSGVYTASSSMGLSGDLTLDAQGDPNAVFIFQAGTTLTTGTDSRVTLINGGSPCNVYWQIGSSATLGTRTDFIGTVLALTSATLDTGATVNGRILARNGAVTLDTNTITGPNCAAAPSPPPPGTPGAPVSSPVSPPPPPGSPAASAAPTVKANPVGTSAGGNNSGNNSVNNSGGNSGGAVGGPSGGNSGGAVGGPSGGTSTGTSGGTTTDTTTTTTTTIPSGHPPTGLGGSQEPGNTSPVLLFLAGLTMTAAVFLAMLRSRPAGQR